MSNHTYGCIPSIIPLTTKFFSATKYKTEVELPNKVDLRQWCSPVFDQGQQGSCVGNATTALREYLEIKNNKTLVPLSRAFIYYEARLKEGTTNEDSGCMPVDAMSVLATTGICSDADMPYSDKDFTTAPSVKDITDASIYKIKSYHVVSSTALMKVALAEGNPVVIGIQVYSSFESDAVASNGIVPIPNIKTEQLLGGHCMTAVGYDLDMQYKYPNGEIHKEFVLVRNSWGTGWGIDGYCWIPFAFFWAKDLVSDYWVGTL